MSAEAFAAAQCRDAAHLHRVLDAMPDDEIRKVADTAALAPVPQPR